MDTSAMTPALALALQASFGSVAGWDTWLACRATTADTEKAQALLAFNPRTGGLSRHWGNEAADLLPGCTQLLAVDGQQPGAIHWAEVSARYQAAVHAASEPWGVGPDGVAGSEVLDVRRAGVFEQSRTRLPGARWCDPARVGEWASALPTGVPITVYCVHGHEVSRATALRLRATGRDARFLRGGIEAWAAAGHALDTLPGQA